MPAEPAQVHGLPVLVVDDNATNRRILEEMLTNWGMKPTVVEGGREALAALEQARGTGSPFALVLLDAMMPEMDGFTLAERIRQDPEPIGSTLMMLSSANRREDAARCRELGVASYLTKPIRQSTLLDAIMTSLGSSASVEGRAARAADRPAPAGGRRTLRLLLAEDNAVNQRLAVSLLEKRGHQVVVAGNGREALAALDRQPFDAVLMDVQMPEMDGFEATAAIRAREAAHRRPYSDHRHDRPRPQGRPRPLPRGGHGRLRLQAAPAPGALRGPGAPRVRGRRCRRPRRPGRRPRPAAFDMAAALERVDGDAELLKELAGLFLDECPQRMAEIRQAIDRAGCLQASTSRPTPSRGPWATSGPGRPPEAAQPPGDGWPRAELGRAWSRIGSTLEEAIGRLEPAFVELGQAGVS